jgi:hypothetical protein
MSDEIEYDVRKSLLAHYSSQTTAHASYLLTMTLVALGVIALRPSWPWLATTTFLLSMVFFRTAFRTWYWGCIAHAILFVDKNVGDPKRFQPRHKELLDSGLKTVKLHAAAATYVDKEHPWIAWYGSFWYWKSWVFPIVFALVLALGLAVLAACPDPIPHAACLWT